MTSTAPSYLWWKNLKIPTVFPKWGTLPYRHMRSAVEASWDSQDPSSHVGATLILPQLGGCMLSAHNTPVIPAPGGKLAEDRDYKLAVTEHAETGVMLSAMTLFGERSIGGQMFAPWAACRDCARIMVAGQLSMLIVHGPTMAWTPVDWRSSVEQAYHTLSEAGIPVYQTTDLLNLSMQIRGQEIKV